MSPYIQLLVHDVILSAVAAAVFIFVVWTLSEVFGLARSARRPFDNAAVPVPGPEAAPTTRERIAAAGRH